MYKLYDRVAPRPEDFGQLLGKMGTSMAKDFDFSDEVRGLTVPTMFVAADADMFPPSHAAEVFALLDGGQRDGGWMREGRPAGGHALASSRSPSRCSCSTWVCPTGPASTRPGRAARSP